MAAKEQLKNENTPVMKRKRKGPEEKARLDSTKHLYYDGPNQKGMTKPLKPIPVFKQVNSKLCFTHVNTFYGDELQLTYLMFYVSCRVKVNTKGRSIIALTRPFKV